MTDKKKIIWLASYPKSGNTWFRVFLANLFSGKEEPVDINNLSEATIASNRQLFDEETGINSSDLTRDEIEKLRPIVYDNLSNKADNYVFLKIHDALKKTSEGKFLISENASFKAIYFIRNPLDVVISFAHHLDTSYEKTADIMCNEKYAFCNKDDRLHNQLEQILFSWSSHVNSWINQDIVPVKVLRYEDMILDTFNTFSGALNFLDLNYETKVIDKALKNSSFKELQNQELNKGFKEKPPIKELFFRKGSAGGWRDELSEYCIDKITGMHSGVMKKFGYMNKNGILL